MENYEGQSKQGPFAKLLETCHYLRWTVEVPRLADAHGVWHDWLEMNEKTLYDLVKDAWMWKVYLEVSHRKDSEGLQGIDHRVVMQARNKIKPHGLSSIFRLQDGTFVEPSQHVKYDLGKVTTCNQCGGEDSTEHRCTSCPGRHQIYLQYAQILQKWTSFSKAKRIHLLPSQDPFWIPFKALVCQAEDQWIRVPCRFEPQHCHLFTDGSCHGSRRRSYQLAAWAVVSATADACVAKGALGGIGQDNDRAELRAIIAAVEYALVSQRETTIWTDSTFGAEGLSRLLHDAMDIPDGHCEDDWMELQGLLRLCEGRLHVQHIPSHVGWSHQDADVDNWAARWNDRADREANMAMRLHGCDLLALHQRLWAHHEGELADLCALQELHLDIVEKQEVEQRSEHPHDVDGEDDFGDWRVHRGWPGSCMPFRGLPESSDAGWVMLYESFGRTFVNNFVQALTPWEEDADTVICKVSFLEIATFLAVDGRRWTPTPHTDRPGCWQDRNAFNFYEPNLGALVRLAKSFLRALDRCFSLGINWCKGISLTILAVYTPLDGLTMAVNAGVAELIAQNLRGFTRRRPIRWPNDLARPMRT